MPPIPKPRIVKRSTVVPISLSYLFSPVAESCSETMPGLLSIPIELRLMIYALLLNPDGSKTLSIRAEDPTLFGATEAATPRKRSKFRIMSDRFRARSILTSYRLTSQADICSSIVCVSRQIHDEAAKFLYSEHAFDFDTDIESIVPFFQDLTPMALASIARVNIVKRALPYVKEFDRCEWRNMCAYMSKNMQLAQLGLGIAGGRPVWWTEAPETFQSEDFRMISDLEGMEWVNEIATITDLHVLDVKAHLAHCPVPTSDAMAFFIHFSSSIETGFAEYLRAQMVVSVA